VQALGAGSRAPIHEGRTVAHEHEGTVPIRHHADPVANRALANAGGGRYERIEMTEFWEAAFTEKQLMWGLEPARSAVLASERFARAGVKEVLIPGVGYGRNARAFLDRGMSVTGIEISETAIALARTALGLEIPIYRGSVLSMPYDEREYDGVFCYGLAYLLDDRARAKLIADCYRQLASGGHMIFTVVSKEAPSYGGGSRLIYDDDSVRSEFGPYGLVELSRIDEPGGSGGSTPFINVFCRKG
jgi:SAM-dependent methyltransferase